MSRQRHIFIAVAWAVALSWLPAGVVRAELPDVQALPENSPQVTEQWLDELQQNLKDTQTIRTRFVQETHLDVFDQVVESHGVMMFAAPDRMRFEIVEPFRSVTVASGDAVVRYEKLDDGWRRLNLPSTEIVLAVLRQAGRWMRGDLKASQKTYAITSHQASKDETSGASGGGWLVLVPRDAALAKMLASIEIELDAKHAAFKRMIIRRSADDATMLRFVDEQRNKPLPAGWFDVTGDVPAKVSPASDASEEPGE